MNSPRGARWPVRLILGPPADHLAELRGQLSAPGNWPEIPLSRCGRADSVEGRGNQKRPRRAMRLGLATTAALLIAAAASSAEALQRRDVSRLDTLYKRSQDLSQSLTEAASAGVSQLNATGDAQTLDCLQSLQSAASQVSDQLM